jgi:BON domain
MKTDGEITDDVIGELERDPQITNSDAIGVAVKDDAVTLTGNVPDSRGQAASGPAAEQVYGVKAGANELEVRLAGAPRDNSEIATAIAHVRENNVQVPGGNVNAGYRTAGSRWTARSTTHTSAAKRADGRQVRGMIGVTDGIAVRGLACRAGDRWITLLPAARPHPRSRALRSDIP